MDPADPNQMKACLEQQGALLGRQRTQLDMAIASIRDLTAQIQPLQLAQLSTTSASSLLPAHEPKLPPSGGFHDSFPRISSRRSVHQKESFVCSFVQSCFR